MSKTCRRPRVRSLLPPLDYVRLFSEQIRPFVKAPWSSRSATDGLGRSDTRERIAPTSFRVADRR